MRMSSIYYRGMFETMPYILPDKALSWNELKTVANNTMVAKVREFMSTNDLACSEIVTNHQKYSKDDLVVLEVIEGIEDLRVGVIKSIVVKDNKVFFVVRAYEAVKHAVGYYETVKLSVDYSFVEAKNLADYKTLYRHGTDTKFQFVLHHHISHDFI